MSSSSKGALPSNAARLAKKERDCQAHAERKWLSVLNDLHPPIELVQDLDIRIAELQDHGIDVDIQTEAVRLAVKYMSYDKDLAIRIATSLAYRFIALHRLKFDSRAKDWFALDDEPLTDQGPPYYIAAMEEKLFRSDIGKRMSFSFDPDRFLACIQRIRQKAAVRLLDVISDPAAPPPSSAPAETS